MKKLLLITIPLFLTACVQLKAPERLVSDTYRTGKEIYHDIADSDSEQHFVHEIVVPEDSELTVEKGRCIDELVTKVREKYDVESYEVTKLVHTEGSTETIYCEISAVML